MPPIKKRRPNIIINFPNKIYDSFNIAKLLNSTIVQNAWPSEQRYKNFSNPIIYYKYNKPLSSKIFNYRQTIEDLNVGQWYAKKQDATRNNQYLCDCASSIYKDEYHKHIITGDLTIIENLELRNIFYKGPKFRFDAFVSIENIVASVNKDLKNYIEKLNKMYKWDISKFTNWRCCILTQITKQLNKFKQLKKYGNSNNNSKGLSKTANNYLKVLQDKYVITSVDKATQNIAIICKHFYIEQCAKELQLDTNNKNKIYKLIGRNQPLIESKLLNDLKTFNIDPIPNYTLPYIHILPKFHKNPIGFRVIIASSRAITKSVSMLLTKILKLMQNKVERRSSYKTKYYGYNPCWIISNNKPILDGITHINKKHCANSVHTFDFTTLYTTLEHKLIHTSFEDLCTTLFKNNKKQCVIKISGNRAYWHKGIANKSTIDHNQVIKYIDWLISNTYFKFGNLILKQEIGIPMGTDCAPFLANLFLYYFEEKFVNNCIKNKEFEKCKNLKFVYRYIDDLTVLNDNNFFLDNFKHIYPDCLDLKLINTSDNTRADVLDIHIEMKNNIFYTSLFDKRKTFPFKCLQFPHRSSCLSSSLFKNVIQCEALRYNSICCMNCNLTNNLSNLRITLLERGYSNEELLNAFHKAFFKNVLLSKRFNNKVIDFIKEI